MRSGRDEVIRLAEITGETAQLCILLGNKYTVAYMQPGSRLFRMNPMTVDGKPIEGAKVRIPIIFNLPD